MDAKQARGRIKALEDWAKVTTKGYRDVHVTDMSGSFRDGLAFCAIINHYRPDLIDFESLSKENIQENNSLAFSVAERQLGVPALLDAEDMVKFARPDRLSIITYLSQLHNCFLNQNRVNSKGGIKVRANSNEGPPAKVTALPGLVAKRHETCHACNHRVFILERLMVDGKLYHTTCFRCCRCNSLLSPADYVEGDTPGQYECAACPESSPSSPVPRARSPLVESAQNGLSSPSFLRRQEGDSPSFLRKPEKDSPSFLRRPEKDSPSFLRRQEKDSPSFLRKDSPSSWRNSSPAFESEGGGVSVKDKINVFETNRRSKPETFFKSIDFAKKLVADSTELDSTSNVAITPTSPSESAEKRTKLTSVSGSTDSISSPKSPLSNTFDVLKSPELTNSDSKSPLNTTLNKLKSPELSSNNSKSPLSSTLKSPEQTSVDKKSPLSSTLKSPEHTSMDYKPPFSTTLKSPEQTSIDSKSPLSSTLKSPEHTSMDYKSPFSTTLKSPEHMSDYKSPLNSTLKSPEHISDYKSPLSSTLKSPEPTSMDSKFPLNTTLPLLKSREQISIDSPTSPSLKSPEAKVCDSASLLNKVPLPQLRSSLLPSSSSRFQYKSPLKTTSKDIFQTNFQPLKLTISTTTRREVPEVKTAGLQYHGIADSPSTLPRRSTPDPLPRRSSLESQQVAPGGDGLLKEESKSLTDMNLESALDILTTPSSKTPVPQVRHSLETRRQLEFSSLEEQPAEEVVEYPDDLNPFGDEEPESGKPTEEGTAEIEYPDDLNPFGDDDEPPSAPPAKPPTTKVDAKQQQPPKSLPAAKPPVTNVDDYDESKNPFADDDAEEIVPVTTPKASPRPPAAPTPSPTGSLQGTLRKRPAPKPPRASELFPPQPSTPSPKVNRVKKPTAPPPPVPVGAKQADSPKQERQTDSPKQAKKVPEAPKKKKRPAPPVPIPKRVENKKIPLKEIVREMKEIEEKQRECERQGRELELLIRDRDKDEEPSIEEEEYIMQLFELVNQKNALFRRQAELMYIKRFQRLEEQQAELQNKIRVLLEKPSEEKSDEDRAEEELLLLELKEVVDQRNSIIDSIEMDRRRELEEDASIQEHIEIKNGDLPIAAELKEKGSGKEKKSKAKKEKKEKKEKEKKEKKKKKGS